MKKFLGLILGAASLGAVAASPAAAEEGGSWTDGFSANVAITNNYVFRGFTQTNKDFAIQGGFDYEHSSGFYAGVWASNLEFNDGSESSIEIDIYGGYAGEIPNSIFSYDVGVLYYAYPGDAAGAQQDFVEFYLNIAADFGFAVLSTGIAYSPNYYDAFDVNNVGLDEYDDTFYIPVGLSVPIPLGNGPVSLSFDANLGFVSSDLNSGGKDEYIHYDVGLNISIEDLFDIGLQYIDTDINGMDDYFVASVSRSF